jgi:5'-3' exonuclease
MRLVLVDGNHLLHRVMNTPGLLTLRTRGGKFTGGVFGFLRALRAELDSLGHAPFVGVVVWDRGKSARRLSIFPDYKKRPDVYPEHPLGDYRAEFLEQQRLLQLIIPKLGVRTIFFTGREADDIIAELVGLTKLRSVYLITEDSDYLQLIKEEQDKMVIVIRPIRKEVWSLSKFMSVKDYHPEFYVLEKALMGDKSDKIPGVKGIGEKTAWRVTRDYYHSQSGCSDVRTFYNFLTGYSLSADDGRYRSYLMKILANVGVLARNVALIDLSLEQFWEAEVEILQDLLEPEERNLKLYDEARETLKELEFKEVLMNYTVWTTPFRWLV